ncbi:MAG: Asp23/Gls24 family envelope stress response protein [Lachnospiraceae bacterium]|nr:Asp23/Gls24 family envelope stress response protein [Lachnospiraceae bacterium]
MQGQMETKYGKISVNTEVIATYAGSIAVECFGIVGMTAVNVKDGMFKLLKKDYLSHGINATIDEDNNISLDFHVIVSYGVSIETVTDNLMETVKYKVESFTGLKVKNIRVFVEGIRVID